ncbi:exosortase [Bradyrhizobium sp. Tv2a-2]|uniref:exosortase n=1 Tax=Bradyrhizobium sp. Tv2a-2 TaxID=113395 RepID=UPI000463FFFB|nr:exosortase [Bradyrhizobium sp. Tv2a-2]
MTISQVAEPIRTDVLKSPVGVGLLGLSCAVAYIPTLVSLINGPWQTEQEGHGPLIIAASIWLAWQARHRVLGVATRPALGAGWIVLLGGLALMFLARTQGVLTVEAFSLLPVICGCVLLIGGWPKLGALAFPIGFLFFFVPMPDWLIDAATVPLKVMISDAVTRVLYEGGYPVAQNGVVIVIGTYQLLVKDTCSGMNSIFALSAIGVFYAYAFRWNDKVRSILLIAAIVPITILANFVRVLTLVLIAYYGGADLLEGPIHDFTGMGLFVVAVILLFLFDAVLGVTARLIRFR